VAQRGRPPGGARHRGGVRGGPPSDQAPSRRYRWATGRPQPDPGTALQAHGSNGGVRRSTIPALDGRPSRSGGDRGSLRPSGSRGFNRSWWCDGLRRDDRFRSQRCRGGRARVGPMIRGGGNQGVALAAERRARLDLSATRRAGRDFVHIHSLRCGLRNVNAHSCVARKYRCVSTTGRCRWREQELAPGRALRRALPHMHMRPVPVAPEHGSRPGPSSPPEFHSPRKLSSPGRRPLTRLRLPGAASPTSRSRPR
jgi:hypothetical protein